MKIILSFWTIMTLASTNISKAAIPSTPTNIASFACIVMKLALDFIPYLIVIAVGAFIMGLSKYVGSGDNEEKRSEGRKMMVYGTVGFFFMVGIWGILQIFVQSFGLSLIIPQFKSSYTESCLSNW